MKLFSYIFLLLFLMIIQSCSNKDFKIDDLKSLQINKIPSGSGITLYDRNYYVIGDDSPFLFVLNKKFEILDSILLIDSVYTVDGRISKSQKPDFEALENINEKELVIFGSGSKSPKRDVFIRVLLNNLTIEKYCISEFYDSLKKLPIMQNSELNIEGVAYYDEDIFLFNRQNNLILKYNYEELLWYFKNKNNLPKPIIMQCKLPTINDIEAGFSGAVALKNEPLIVFTASVENTENAYDDGEILGSFVGVINISNNTISDVIDYYEISTKGEKLKIESVSILEELDDQKADIVLISDDDKGNSIVLNGTLSWYN